MDQKGITVYCASSPDINEEYRTAARRLARSIVQTGLPIVNGAGKSGLMGEINNACLEAGGTAIGVIPQFMVDRGWHHTQLSRLIVTPDMHTRKQTMARLSKAAIALPGGCGTLEELLEIITWKQLGLYDGNIVILNLRGYYDNLIKMLDEANRQGFMRPSISPLWATAETPEEAIDIALRR